MRAMTPLAGLAAAACLSTAASGQDYGPNAGYIGNDIPNAFTDISGSGTDITGLLTNLDDGGLVVPIGFSFDLFGTSISSIGFATNGYMAAPGQPLTDFTNNCPIASASTPNSGIYPYWSDLRLNEHGAMHHETAGTVFRAQWTDVGSFDDSGASVTMQVRLDGSDDSIEFHYGVMDSGPLGSYDATGGEGSTGIENDTGSAALEINCNTPGALSSAAAFRIEPEPVVPLVYCVADIANAFSDISGSGTDITGLLTNLDDGGVVVPIGFSFQIYGTSITSIGFATNGYMAAPGQPLTDFTNNCPIASASTPNLGIYPYWSDLRLNEHGAMHHETVGTVFTAQWTDVGSFDDSGASVTMQVRLDGSDDSIEFHYGVMDSGPLGSYDATGGEGSTGIENETGTDAVEINCNTPGALGDTVAFRIFEGTVATSAVRVGSCGNPVRLSAPGPVIGTTWTGTYTPAAGSLTDVLIIDVLGTMLDMPTAFGCLLCMVPLDSTRVLIEPSPGSPTTFTVAIPNDPSIVGDPVCVQAGSVTGTGPLVLDLANALDLTVGDCQ